MGFETPEKYAEIAGKLEFNTRALIDGRLVEAVSGETFESMNPATGRVITAVSKCGPADVDKAAAAARHSFDSGAWSRMDPAERKAILLKFADLIEAKALELAVMESIDSGKPIVDTIYIDLPETVGCFRFAAEAIDKLNDDLPPTSEEYLSIVRREPIGVCAGILPWNFPIMMAAWKLAPILAAGNSVVVKPSKLTSLTLLKLGELSLEAGIPPGVLNVITGPGAELGPVLGRHPDIDLITFTGSTAVGRSLLTLSAESNLKRVLLELGGKNPAVVMPDIDDLDWAAGQIVTAGLWNMGQNCTQNSRVIIHRDIKDRLLPKIIDEVAKWRTGDPLNAGNRLGPLIEKDHMDSVLGYIEKGKAEGAELICGGERILKESGGFFVSPCLFDQVKPSMTIAREEIFGPVFGVLTCGSLEEGIAMANDTEYGLHASVWSGSITGVHKLARNIKAGVISVNHYSEGGLTTPFGGFKQSGFMGRDKSIWANRQYTELKSVVIKVG